MEMWRFEGVQNKFDPQTEVGKNWSNGYLVYQIHKFELVLLLVKLT